MKLRHIKTFDKMKCQKIILKLAKNFNTIMKLNRWYTLSFRMKLTTNTYYTRNTRWHRDWILLDPDQPNEDKNAAVEDYILLNLITDAKDPRSGWGGGNLHIKRCQTRGRWPNTDKRIKTYVHKYKVNEAIIIDNKKYVHKAPRIITKRGTKRLLINMRLSSNKSCFLAYKNSAKRFK